MNDTSPEVEALYRRMLMRLPPGERITMACEMFTTVRTLMRAGIAAPDEAEMRRRIFRRLYARDIPDEAFRERIEAEIVCRARDGAR